MKFLSISIDTEKSVSEQNILSSLSAVISSQCLESEGRRIVLLIAKHTGISPELILHHSRCRSNIADARQLAMYLLHVGMGRSMSEVGKFFGRDRTTVSHACNKIEDRRDEIKFDDFVLSLEEEIELQVFESDENLDLKR